MRCRSADRPTKKVYRVLPGYFGDRWIGVTARDQSADDVLAIGW
jgi:hypothetical protein